MSLISRFFKKSPAPAEIPAEELTFKQRVETFWEWYASVSDRFLDAIDAKNSSGLVPEVSTKMDELFPGQAWVFGPPPEGETGHSFTLSGEGVKSKQLLAFHAADQAPPIAGWTFYGSRQPSFDLPDFKLSIGDLDFRPIEFWVTPQIDEESRNVDITVWHPLFDQVSERAAKTALFLILDELFGELGTGRWIGEIAFDNKKLTDSMPIAELKEFVHAACIDHQWGTDPTVESWSIYKLKTIGPGPRKDTIAGTTGCWAPLRQFLDDPDDVEDPFEGFHADWIYLSLDTAFLPKGEELDAREDLAEAIEKHLIRERSGRYLGGAIGTARTYLDFLIYDGSRSIDLVRQAAKELGLPATTRIEYLASSKRSLGHDI